MSEVAGVHSIKGGFMFDGDVYPPITDAKILTHIRDDLTLRADDILVSTYNKAGRHYIGICFIEVMSDLSFIYKSDTT